jgi:hypothetical protein
MGNQERIDSIEKHGLSAVGRELLTKHLKGERLTTLEAIKAKCYDCMNMYADGKVSCNLEACLLFQYMPYNKKRVIKKRVLSEDQRNELRIRFKKARISR